LFTGPQYFPAWVCLVGRPQSHLEVNEQKDSFC